MSLISRILTLMLIFGLTRAASLDEGRELDHSNLERAALSESTRYELGPSGHLFRSTTPGLWTVPDQAAIDPAFVNSLSRIFYRLLYRPIKGDDGRDQVMLNDDNWQNGEQKRNQLLHDERDYNMLPLALDGSSSDSDYDLMNDHQRGTIAQQRIVVQQQEQHQHQQQPQRHHYQHEQPQYPDRTVHRLRDMLPTSHQQEEELGAEQPRIMRRGKCLKDSKSNNQNICDSGAYLHAADYTTNLWDAAGR